MRIWVIGRNYPLPNNQMQGSFELEQSKMLAKREKMEISYLAASLHPNKKIKRIGFQNWNEDGVSIFTNSIFFFPRVYPFYFCKLRNKIWRNFLNRVEDKTGLPDVIHLHYPVMMMLADVLEEYKKKGVKIVVTEHWTKVLAKKNDFYELKQLKKYASFVDSFICVGEPLKKIVTELTGSMDNIIVVPNIINQAFSPSSEEHEGYDFVAVGRLAKHKQFDQIIIAFSKCFKNIPKVKLTIIGSGREKENLLKIVKEFGVEDKVTFTGTMNRNDTANIVSKSDCLICYSSFETFGVPIIEAWACGIPAIFTTACAVISNMDERLGIELSPYDINKLEHSMKYMFENKKNFNKQYISEYAFLHYSEKIISDLLINIYLK